MKWYRRLRWKLLVSHVLIGVVSVGVLLVTIVFLALSSGWRTAPDGATVALQSAPHDALLWYTLRDALIVASLAALEAALIVSIFISWRIVEPIQTVTAVSRRLAQGFYHERTVTPNSQDELAELSQSVNQLADTLERTEQRRMALVADVTHELRTPLATIGGYMEGLIDGVIEPSRQTYELVLLESQRLQRLMDDLQLLSRVEARQLPIVVQRVDTRRLLLDVAMRLQPEFAAQTLTLHAVVPDTLPMIMADPDRVNQILVNLLTNARCYTPAGGRVTIRGRSNNEYVIISVEDTGVGIAPEHQARVFERFYRVDKSRARASGGSGIGLTIARYLVDAQGGRMWLTSAGAGKGAQFHFSLPRTEILFANSTGSPVSISSEAHVPIASTNGDRSLDTTEQRWNGKS